MCRKARREWRPNRAGNRNRWNFSRRESRTGFAASWQTEILAAEIHVCATRLEEKDGAGLAACLGADVRRSERGSGVVVRGEMEIEFGGMQRVRRQRADQWMLASVGKPVAVNPDSRLRQAARRQAGPSRNGRGKFVRKRNCKDGSGKSAMKKRDGLDSPEAILAWPQSEAREPALQGLARICKNELAEAWRACGAFEWIALGTWRFRAE